MDHDRPIRLADILAQMWNATGPEPAGEDGLQLKVRCRMSMSHVYDTVWRWRQRFRPVKSIEEMQGKLRYKMSHLFSILTPFQPR